MLTGDGEGTTRVWDARTGQEKATLKGHVLRVLSVAWSPDGERVLTMGEDGTMRIWDARPVGREFMPPLPVPQPG